MKCNRLKIAFVILLVIVIIIILLVLYKSKHQDKISIVANNSYFSDFCIKQENTVEIYCRISIKSTYNIQKTVNIVGKFTDDVNSGLLKEEKLIAYNTETYLQNFELQPNEIASFDVVFIGSYGGNSKKKNRLLPEIEVVIVE